MLKIRSKVSVNRVTGKELLDYMLNCTDEDYQQWWPGTHLAFHTIRRTPNNIGNLVCFDEYIGKRRLKFKGVIVELIPDRKIVWQMKKRFRIPAWLELRFEEHPTG